MKTKVLGIAYGGGHANIVIPVLEALRDRGIATGFIGLTAAGPQAERAGMVYRAYADYRHLVDWRRAKRLGMELAREMHNPSLGIPFDESLAYLGINLLENIDSLGEELATDSLRLAGRNSFLPVAFMEKVLAEENCTHLLTTNSPRSEKAALIAAGRLGLVSFRVDDLYGMPTLFESLIARLGTEKYYRTTGRYKTTPTQSCFLCDFARDHFISLQHKWDIENVGPENSTVTGQPIFDAIDEMIKAAPANPVFENSSLPTVTWAHENGHYDEAEVMSILQDCVRDYGDRFNLAVKIRPNIAPEKIHEIVRPFGNNPENLRVIHAEMDPNLLLWNSDMVLGQVSTLLTQSAYMGRPVVILDPLGRRVHEPLVVTGLAQVAASPGELIGAIESLRNRNSRQFREFEQGREAMNFIPHGTRNICNLIGRYI